MDLDAAVIADTCKEDSPSGVLGMVPIGAVGSLLIVN